MAKIGGSNHTWANSKLHLEGSLTINDPIKFNGSGEEVTIEINGTVTVNVAGVDAAITGTGVSVNIEGVNGKADTLTLEAASNSALSVVVGDLKVKGITLNATGHSPVSAVSGSWGYAGIWVLDAGAKGNIVINNANVTASGTNTISNEPNEPAFGIFARSAITIEGDSDVKADAKQTGNPGARAAGIFSRDKDITISDTASVTAAAESKSAAAGGIYSEHGSVKINSTGTVTAYGESQSSDTTENQGLGIAAGGNTAIENATVNATGKSASGESAGIAAAVPGSENTLPSGSGKVDITSGNVTAEGLGDEGHGIVVEGAGDVEIGTGATVTAVAHGAGYAIDANTGTITNNGTANLKADDETHYSSAPVGGTGTTTTSPNTPPARPSRGGCDTGLGSFAALFALGTMRVIRRKRP
ncbi:MAG: hypothetical protein LBS35_14410 [Synergistaceae bacterium]|nr:hypothetical protein [Synergistaceae bacterium]